MEFTATLASHFFNIFIASLTSLDCEGVFFAASINPEISLSAPGKYGSYANLIKEFKVRFFAFFNRGIA